MNYTHFFSWYYELYLQKNPFFLNSGMYLQIKMEWSNGIVCCQSQDSFTQFIRGWMRMKTKYLEKTNKRKNQENLHTLFHTRISKCGIWALSTYFCPLNQGQMQTRAFNSKQQNLSAHLVHHFNTMDTNTWVMTQSLQYLCKICTLLSKKNEAREIMVRTGALLILYVNNNVVLAIYHKITVHINLKD